MMYKSELRSWRAKGEDSFEAVAYMRTSSSTNVGEGEDSDKRQRVAIEAYAKVAGYAIAPDDSFYDAAVKGADPAQRALASLPCSTVSPATVSGPSSLKVPTGSPATSLCSLQGTTT